MNEEKENDEGQATRDLEPCTGKRSEDFSEIGSRFLKRLLKKEVENEEVQATQGLEPCLRETEERSGASSSKVLRTDKAVRFQPAAVIGFDAPSNAPPAVGRRSSGLELMAVSDYGLWREKI